MLMDAGRSSRPLDVRRIAVIGAGVSGLGAALAIARGHRPTTVTIFERAASPGGHCATVDIDYDGVRMAVDTGFIVYNEANYPQLTALFDWLGVATQPSDMSFSVSSRGGRFEWAGRGGPGRLLSTLDGLFARRAHIVSPRFYNLLREILRFESIAVAELRAGRVDERPMDEWLTEHGFSERLRDDYLIPMGAAIWSSAPVAVLAFPACFFLAFFDNHALLRRRRPQWRTVTGGSRVYVERLTAALEGGLRLGTAAKSVCRRGGHVLVEDSTGSTHSFDAVILATHAPEALRLLGDATLEERSALGAFRIAANEVVLHRDHSLMPRRRAAWAAWNFIRDDLSPDAQPTVTYWMNALQALDPNRPLFVSLNPVRRPDPRLTFGRFIYDHPLFGAGVLDAQAALARIQGRNGLWFCGAWTGNGFHEAGLTSGLAAARALGAPAPWLDQAGGQHLPDKPPDVSNERALHSNILERFLDPVGTESDPGAAE